MGVTRVTSKQTVIKHISYAASRKKKPVEHFLSLFKTANELETLNTERFQHLSKLATSEGDNVTFEFCLYYLREQASAEDESGKWLTKAEAYHSMRGLFWHLDKELDSAAAIGTHPPDLNFTGLYK